MARAARDTGHGAMLFPAGIDSVEDIHWDLAFAIEHANTVISWQRNLSKKEMPPRWMWPFPDELEIWFEEVEMIRDKESGGSSDDESMDSNVLAKEGVRQQL